MTVNRRKKNSRQQGSHTHGWGAMKKHRGAGNHGGAGNAGTGKRGDANKPSIWHQRWFGKFGFTSVMRRHVTTMNLLQLEQRLDSLLAEKKAVREGDVIAVDLSALGIDKLLGAGKITQKLKITVVSASKKAQHAVAEAGGEVVLPGTKKAE